MYEFKEMILPKHFKHASYSGFCVKPGMFYGVEKETGKLVATTGWNANGLTNICMQNEPKSKWSKDLWEDLYDDDGNPLITIEKNDLQRISSKVKEFQRTAMDFETWANANGYTDEYYEDLIRGHEDENGYINECHEDLIREEMDQIESAYEWYYFMEYPEFVIQLLKELWAMEKNVEILMEDGCTRKEAEKHLNNGTVVYTLEDFTENFEFMKNFHEDADEIEADKKIKKMLETKIPMDGYSFVKYDGKEWLISYCL